MTWTPTLTVDTSVPLHVQIRRGIRDAVESGDLLPGQQLPGIRALAEQLGVNRLTVLKAVEALSKAGLLNTVQGKGIFVSSDPRIMELRAPRAPASVGPFFEGVAEGPAAEQDTDLLKATIDNAMTRDAISFAAGFPPPEAVPTDTIRIRLSRMLRAEDAHVRLGYASTQGDPELLEEVRKLLVVRGLPPGADDRLVITGGAQQGLTLCLEALLRPGECLAMESPGYMGAIAACRMKKIPMVPVPVDRAGLNPDRLESALRRNEIRVIYTVPNFQNPTAVTQTLRRRRQILELAGRYNALVIEDDIYSDLRFGGRGVSPIKSLPGGERVVYLGSFSKSLTPAVRLGFLVATGPLGDDLRRFKEVADMCTSALIQALMTDLLRSGYYRRHLAKVRRLYRARQEACLAALQEHMPAEVQFTRPKGGMHLWVMLDRPVDAARLLPRARRVGVSFAPGNLFFSDGRRSGSFRLNYSSNPPERIDEGIRRLVKCIDEEARA